MPITPNDALLSKCRFVCLLGKDGMGITRQSTRVEPQGVTHAHTTGDASLVAGGR